MDKPVRLTCSSLVDIPIREVSGLAVRRSGGNLQVLAVGDHTAHVAVADYSHKTGFGDWKRIDLASIDGWPLPSTDSQMEAIAVDGGCLVALLREDPPVVLVADTDAKDLVAQILLTTPSGSPLAGYWDDPSSRGEGLVMLRGGRLLVAKEKKPSALVEFGPVGSIPQGLSRGDFLGPGEAWDTPNGSVEYAATAMWRLKGSAKESLADISALAVGSDRSLWLLSDKSRSVGRLSLETPLRATDHKVRKLDGLWRLPKKTEKPEGIVALDDRHIMVGMDTRSKRRNGAIIRRKTR